MPVRDPEHDFVLKLCDTVLHIQWQTIQEFFQDGYGFLLKRQVAVILQGLTGKEYRFCPAFRKSDRRQNTFFQDMIPACRPDLGVKGKARPLQRLQIAQDRSF